MTEDRVQVRIIDAFKDEKGKSLGIPAGELWQDPLSGSIMFRYYGAYLKLGPKAVPIDPVNLPLNARKFFLGRHGSGTIRDSAPDSWGRMVIDSLPKKRAFREIDYIAFPNPARIGNLDFGPPRKDKPVRIADLAILQPIYRKIESSLDLKREEKIYLNQRLYGASIGGARPKCSVIGENGVLWIAKLASLRDDRPEARIEAAALNLAAKCGLNVCHAEVRSIGGLDALFLRRFDRRPDGSRIGFISAHSVLGVGRAESEEEKHGLRDYRLLAERMRKYGAEEDLPELFKRIAFNIIVRNIDDHERNHAFLIDDGKIRLSPLYDVVPSGFPADMERPPIMAMSIGIRGRLGSRENLLSAAAFFGLSNDEAGFLFDSVCNVIAANWRETCADFGLSAEDLGHVRDVLEWWERNCGHQQTGMRP